ncbi:MAG: hypothetical protein WAL59_26695 [Roseiarcus sp.]
MNSPREIYEQQYKDAAGGGAIIELRLRLLADKVPELQKLAHDVRLEEIVTVIVRHFADVLTEDEKTTLTLCRQLRNKVLHCDFRAARGKLGQLGVDTQSGDVKKVDIRGLSGIQMGEKIARVEAGDKAAFEYVADSRAEPGSVFGWLIEAGEAGDFKQATDAFARAAVIVHRLACI